MKFWKHRWLWDVRVKFQNALGVRHTQNKDWTRAKLNSRLFVAISRKNVTWQNVDGSPEWTPFEGAVLPGSLQKKVSQHLVCILIVFIFVLSKAYTVFIYFTIYVGETEIITCILIVLCKWWIFKCAWFWFFLKISVLFGCTVNRPTINFTKLYLGLIG